MKKHLIITLVVASTPFSVLGAIGIPGVTAGATPSEFIGQIYKFTLLISGVLALGAIVYGGAKYMMAAGNPSGQNEGKEWIKGAIFGLLLLFFAYLILNVINPDITSLSLPALAPIPPPPISPPGSGNFCQAPPSGGCSIISLQANGGSCFGSNAAIAGGVCSLESANGALLESTTDKCDDGSSVSFGLFQINISANNIGGLNCISAFSNPFSGKTPNCTIKDYRLYNQCRQAALDVTKNIQKACQLSGGGTNWRLWGPRTRQACNL